MTRLILIVVLVVIVLAILVRRKQPPPPLIDEIRPLPKDETLPGLRAGEEGRDITELPSEVDESTPEERRDT